MDLSPKIEAILFWKAEPVLFSKLASLLKCSTEDIKIGLNELQKKLVGRGLSLVMTDDEASIGTSKEHSALIESLTKEELSKDIGRAGLETLSIILYQGPISRADIDFIRGVNSQFIVRNLLVRGLIERVENPKDARSFLYKPTITLLSHMGLQKIQDLPEFEKVNIDIQSFKAGGNESKLTQ